MNHPPESPNEDALRVLEVLAQSSQTPLDRILASRALGEATRAIPGDDRQTWARRLVEVGESLNLRVRSVECSLADALTFVRQGIGMATCVERPDGQLQWLLLVGCRGRRIRLASLDPAAPEELVRRKSVRRMLGVSSDSTPIRWVLGQPALPCESASRRAEGGPSDQAPTPLSRLFALLAPERQDILIVTIFSAVVGILALATPVAVEALVNTVAFGRYLQPVVILAIMLCTFLGFAAAIRAMVTYVVEILQRRLFIRVVEDLAYRLPRVGQHALDQFHGPELANRFFDVVTVQKVAAGLLLDGIGIVLQTVIGMLVLAFYHPFLLGFDVFLLLLLAVVVFVLGRGATRTAVKESKAKYKLGNWMQEILRHPTAFKLHAGSQFALDRADELAVHWLETRQKHFRVLMRQILFALAIQVVGATLVLGLGGWLVIQGELNLGQLVAAELIVMVIVASFAKLGKHMESFYDLLAAVDKLGVLYDLPIEAHDKLFHLADHRPASVQARDLTLKLGGELILRDLNFTLRTGERVALTGPPASGKSSLIDLLSGIRQPTTGHLELDGIDLRELRPDSLRENLAVARSVEIFGGSIDENVHLNRSQTSAFDVREALDAVGLLDEVLRLPDGLNTVLQTDGAPLSGSQALRLMLARAIVGRPRLLLIDGTLDSLSDHDIRSILTPVLAKESPWTLVVATGRQQVLEACERSIELSTEELIRHGKLYRLVEKIEVSSWTCITDTDYGDTNDGRVPRTGEVRPAGASARAIVPRSSTAGGVHRRAADPVHRSDGLRPVATIGPGYRQGRGLRAAGTSADGNLSGHRDRLATSPKAWWKVPA